ncbi:MAG: HIT family protein [Kiloniellales bacterium]
MTDQPDCIFCKIVAGEVPCFKLWEDADTLAFMDINPANPGHALVVAKEHHQDLFALPEALLAACLRTAKKVAAAQREILEPDGLNLVQANGPGAAQSVPHFHMHVLPRRQGDDLPLNWELRPGNMEEIGALADRIRARL